MDYELTVVARGEKRDVYLQLPQHGKRHLFSMKKSTYPSGYKTYLLRHVPKYKLGALFDMFGHRFYVKLCTLLYDKIVHSTIPLSAEYHVSISVDVSVPTNSHVLHVE